MESQMPLNSWCVWDEATQGITASCQNSFSLGYSHASKSMPLEASFKELSRWRNQKFFDLRKDVKSISKCWQTREKSESTYLKIKSPSQISLLISDTLIWETREEAYLNPSCASSAAINRTRTESSRHSNSQTNQILSLPCLVRT